MNYFTNIFWSIKRVGTIVNKSANNEGNDWKYPEMTTVHFRHMEKGDESILAKLIVESFADDFSNAVQRKNLSQVVKFLEKGFKYDDSLNNNFILAVGKADKQIRGVCKLRDSNQHEKSLPLSELFKTISFRGAIIMLLSFASFEILNKQMVKDEQIFEFFAVDSKYRKQGIGRNLIRYSECLAKERKANKISLIVHENNHSAIRLYKSEGFIITHTIEGLPTLRFGNKVSYKMEKGI